MLGDERLRDLPDLAVAGLGLPDEPFGSVVRGIPCAAGSTYLAESDVGWPDDR